MASPSWATSGPQPHCPATSLYDPRHLTDRRRRPEEASSHGEEHHRQGDSHTAPCDRYRVLLNSRAENQDGCRSVVLRPRPSRRVMPSLGDRLMADPVLSPTGVFHPLKTQSMLSRV